ncbi:MAG: cell division protein FtsZ [Paludibacteraceae bacterium]|nr:cell division protein FtsZ [Paludibacteraceae bacterium]MBQ9295757.1 cell division protein FtsZ [Paludibacteraceae bacterium]
MDEDLITLPLDGLKEDSIIKVIGVGGGGCNAVNYMHRQGLKDVSFLVCNTDRQVLQKSSVPSKLQLGPGLGAGGDPEAARQYAEESKEHIREALNDGTQMLFITAGMGGGTGTGASAVVAEVAQEMGILTVGIVTIPFAFEGKRKIVKAMTGVARLAKHVDALLIINNEKLKQIYPELNLLNAFSKSDDVVANAARAIAEIITVPGYINTDFADVRNTLKKGGVAIMNVGRASGENRITNAISDALNSPLVNTNDVHGAERILLQFYCSTEHAIVMEEIDQINDFVQEVGDDIEVQWGASIDETLGEDVRVTIIATGYKVDGLPTEEAEAGRKTIDEAIQDNYPPQVPNPMEDEPVQLIDLSDTLREAGMAAPAQPRERVNSVSADDVVITIDEEPETHTKEPEEKPARSPFGWIRRK